mgnify:FL=1
MLGAIAGDIIGSVYEFEDKKPDYNFELFHKYSHYTDDTVLTVALADSILSGVDYLDKVKEYYKFYPNAGYGGMFRYWAATNNSKPYNSYGNGSAMRVSPVGWAYNDLQTVIQKAKESAEITHNHPEGIKGAQATAAAIFMARNGSSKDDIKDFITETFHYDLNFDLENLRNNYTFNESCQGTVPQAIYTFLISDNFEDSIRKAIYIGGDSDTLACINGAIAEAFYGIPEAIKSQVYEKLNEHLAGVTKKFEQKFIKC